MSMSKLVLAAAAVVALASNQALAQTTTTTTTAVPVRLGQNIVTIVLVIGISVAMSLGFALWKAIPKIRSGELSLKNIEFDWRAELLNQTPRKEKERRANEAARRANEAARRADELAGGHVVQVGNDSLAEREAENEPLSGGERHAEVFVPENEQARR